VYGENSRGCRPRLSTNKSTALKLSSHCGNIWMHGCPQILRLSEVKVQPRSAQKMKHAEMLNDSPRRLSIECYSGHLLLDRKEPEPPPNVPLTVDNCDPPREERSSSSASPHLRLLMLTRPLGRLCATSSWFLWTLRTAPS